MGKKKRCCTRPKKDDVIVALLRMTRQPTQHLWRTPSDVPSKEPRELDPMVLANPSEGKGFSWKSGATARRWWSGPTARQGKGRRRVHKQLREWWSRGVNVRRREDHWENNFREHEKEAVAWAEEGARGLTDEWKDASDVDWCDRNLWVLGWKLPQKWEWRWHVG